MEGSEHEIVERLDQLTGMVNVRRLTQHEAVDAIGQEGGSHTVTGDVTDAHDDMLVVLEVHRRIITPDAHRGSKIADDLDVPTPVVDRNHASVHEFRDLEIPFETPLSTSAHKHPLVRFVLVF